MAYSPLGIKYLKAIEDWKAPFEVAKSSEQAAH